MWPVDLHVGYALDRYQDWPVGWQPIGDRIAAIQAETFTATVRGSEEYLAGYNACLDRIRALLSQPL